jgi:hypothetical protein
MKLSFLGINNTLRFEALRAGDHTTDPSIVNKVFYADDSLRAWAKEYPRDPQLVRSYFLAAAVYKKIWTKPAQERAWAYMQLILEEFPESYFGKQVRKELALGFTERYYAQALPCPTPSPSASPSASPAPPARRSHARVASPSPSPAASPSQAPAASPSPSPAASLGSRLRRSTDVPESPATGKPVTPSPLPSVRQAPYRPKVQILIPPCAVPATPSASPAPTPTPPVASPSPGPGPSLSPRPTPGPSSSPSASASPGPIQSPSPGPRRSPSQSPSASPSPGATVQTLPGVTPRHPDD